MASAGRPGERDETGAREAGHVNAESRVDAAVVVAATRPAAAPREPEPEALDAMPRPTTSVFRSGALAALAPPQLADLVLCLAGSYASVESYFSSTALAGSAGGGSAGGAMEEDDVRALSGAFERSRGTGGIDGDAGCDEDEREPLLGGRASHGGNSPGLRGTRPSPSSPPLARRRILNRGGQRGQVCGYAPSSPDSTPGYIASAVAPTTASLVGTPDFHASPQAPSPAKDGADQAAQPPLASLARVADAHALVARMAAVSAGAQSSPPASACTADEQPIVRAEEELRARLRRADDATMALRRAEQRAERARSRSRSRSRSGSGSAQSSPAASPQQRTSNENASHHGDAPNGGADIKSAKGNATPAACLAARPEVGAPAACDQGNDDSQTALRGAGRAPLRPRALSSDMTAVATCSPSDVAATAAVVAATPTSTDDDSSGDEAGDDGECADAREAGPRPGQARMADTRQSPHSLAGSHAQQQRCATIRAASPVDQDCCTLFVIDTAVRQALGALQELGEYSPASARAPVVPEQAAAKAPVDSPRGTPGTQPPCAPPVIVATVGDIATRVNGEGDEGDEDDSARTAARAIARAAVARALRAAADREVRDASTTSASETRSASRSAEGTNDAATTRLAARAVASAAVANALAQSAGAAEAAERHANAQALASALDAAAQARRADAAEATIFELTLRGDTAAEQLVLLERKAMAASLKAAEAERLLCEATKARPPSESAPARNSARFGKHSSKALAASGSIVSRLRAGVEDGVNAAIACVAALAVVLLGVIAAVMLLRGRARAAPWTALPPT